MCKKKKNRRVEQCRIIYSRNKCTVYVKKTPHLTEYMLYVTLFSRPYVFDILSRTHNETFF